LSRASVSQEEIEQLVREFYSLPYDKRVEIVKTVLGTFIEKARSDPISAAIEFIVWLSTVDGAIVWGYLPREKFVEEWKELGLAIIELGRAVARMLVGS